MNGVKTNIQFFPRDENNKHDTPTNTENHGVFAKALLTAGPLKELSDEDFRKIFDPRNL